MAGRWTGSVLLLVAITALTAGHGLFRPVVGGSPLSMSIPAPPRPGECALSVPDPVLQVPAADAVAPTLLFGSCTGAVAGEIVSVTAGRPAAPDTSIGAIMGISGDCWAAASRYVGFATAGGVADLPPVSTAVPSTAVPTTTVDWRPELQVRGQRVRATALQRSAGRDWSACLVRPQNLAVYLGSVRGALATGTAPAEYGNCSPSPDPAVQSVVPCSYPHPVERLGWTMIAAGSLSRSQLDASCRALAARLLRTADPTYSGVLGIVTTTGDVSSCLTAVRGTARLTGSLIGIGDGPLPLTT